MFAISVNDRIVKKDLTENEAVELAKKESLTAGHEKVFIFQAKSYVVNQPILVDLVAPEPLPEIKDNSVKNILEEIKPEIGPVKKEFPEKGKMEYKELLEEFLDVVFKTKNIQELEELVSKYSNTALVESNIFKDSISAQEKNFTRGIIGIDGKLHSVEVLKEKIQEKINKTKNEKDLNLIFDSQRCAYPGIEKYDWFNELFNQKAEIKQLPTGGMVFEGV